MGKNNYVGIDIGHDRLKLASVRSGKVRKVATAQMPENLMKNGRIVSHETMIELIRKTMKENGIKESNAAVLLPSETTYVRNVSMPIMNAEQLELNLPYEFRDYFNEELHDYYYDFAMYSEAPEEGDVMNLLAVATRKETIDVIRELMKRSGLKAEVIAPAASAYQNLIRICETKGAEKNEEYCFIDLGYKNVHMNFYRGQRHIAMRELENGVELVDNAIAAHYNVDKHLAHTYLLGNFEDSQRQEACIDAYNSIAVEVLRSINFYQFSNPDSQLTKVYVCGGGAGIVPMLDMLREVLTEVEIHNVSELISAQGVSEQEIDDALLAIGVAMA